VTSAKVPPGYVGPEGADRSIIEPGEAIVIVPARSADCLRVSLLQSHPTLRIVSPDEFRRAAFADQPADGDAQNNLGNMYRNGEACRRTTYKRTCGSRWRAGRFPPLEAEKHDKAIQDREEVAAKMTAEQIAKAQRLAREWTPK